MASSTCAASASIRCSNIKFRGGGQVGISLTYASFWCLLWTWPLPSFPEPLGCGRFWDVYCLWGIGGHRRAFGSSTCDKDPTVDVLQAVKILKMLRCLEFAGSLFPFDCESGAENNLDT